jgi:hypothetical protein
MNPAAADASISSATGLDGVAGGGGGGGGGGGVGTRSLEGTVASLGPAEAAGRRGFCSCVDRDDATGDSLHREATGGVSGGLRRTGHARFKSLFLAMVSCARGRQRCQWVSAGGVDESSRDSAPRKATIGMLTVETRTFEKTWQNA